MRRGANEFDADARLAADAPAHVHHAAFLLGLVAHVGEVQPLPAHDCGFHRYQAAVLIRVNCAGLLVERLLIRAGAVHEQRDAVYVAKPLPPVGICGTQFIRAEVGDRAVFPREPLAFRLS